MTCREESIEGLLLVMLNVQNTTDCGHNLLSNRLCAICPPFGASQLDNSHVDRPVHSYPQDRPMQRFSIRCVEDVAESVCT